MQTKLVLKQPSALKLRFQPGATGPAGTIEILDTITGAPGTDADVANSGTPTAAALTFTVPRGDVGPANSLAIGTVTTGAPGSSASASITGTPPSQTLNLTIPRGDQGPSGSVTDGDKGDITVSGSGTVWTVDAPVLAPYLKRDGSSTVTADIPLSGFKLTGVGDAAAATDALNRQSGDARFHSILSGLGLNNRLINGAMRVSQRGTSFTANGYTLDRWSINFGSGGVGSITQTTVVSDDLAFSLVWAQTTGGTSPTLTQSIEDVRSLAGKRVCISFSATLVSGSSTLTPRLTQFFGTGGSPSSSVSTTGTAITLTGGRVFQFITLPTVVGKTLGSNGDDCLRFELIASSGATFNISLTDVQVEEVPSVAAGPTPFERVPIGLTMALCQRYFTALPTPDEVPYGAASPAVMESSRYLPERMRAAPSASIQVFPTLSNCTAFSVTPSTRMVKFAVTITGPAAQFAYKDGLIWLSAEL